MKLLSLLLVCLFCSSTSTEKKNKILFEETIDGIEVKLKNILNEATDNVSTKINEKIDIISTQIDEKLQLIRKLYIFFLKETIIASVFIKCIFQLLNNLKQDNIIKNRNGETKNSKMKFIIPIITILTGGMFLNTLFLKQHFK
jgi:hypothetical protein